MARRLPALKARDVMRVLNAAGFRAVRQKGSHVFFKHSDGRTTLVPRHDREDISRGLLHQILHEAELTPEEFSKLLRK